MANKKKAPPRPRDEKTKRFGPITEERKAQIRKYIEMGKNNSQIARELKVSRETVANVRENQSNSELTAEVDRITSLQERYEYLRLTGTNTLIDFVIFATENIHKAMQHHKREKHIEINNNKVKVKKTILDKKLENGQRITVEAIDLYDLDEALKVYQTANKMLYQAMGAKGIE